MLEAAAMAAGIDITPTQDPAVAAAGLPAPAVAATMLLAPSVAAAVHGYYCMGYCLDCRNWIGLYLGWYLPIGSLVARLNNAW